jgi:hypothetical protein
MSDLRSRILENKKEYINPAVLVIDDFLPLFGAICLFPMVINASSKVQLSNATPIQALAVSSSTFVSVSLLLITVSSLQTTDIGRWIAVSVSVPVLLLALSGLDFVTYYLIGVLFTVVTVLIADLTAE